MSEDKEPPFPDYPYWHWILSGIATGLGLVISVFGAITGGRLLLWGGTALGALSWAYGRYLNRVTKRIGSARMRWWDWKLEQSMAYRVPPEDPPPYAS